MLFHTNYCLKPCQINHSGLVVLYEVPFNMRLIPENSSLATCFKPGLFSVRPKKHWQLGTVSFLVVFGNFKAEGVLRFQGSENLKRNIWDGIQGSLEGSQTRSEKVVLSTKPEMCIFWKLGNGHGSVPGKVAKMQFWTSWIFKGTIELPEPIAFYGYSNRSVLLQEIIANRCIIQKISST